MDLHYKNWDLSVGTNGGRLTALIFGGKPVLGTYTRIDGKIGNTHLCLPSFDKEGTEKYGLPFHGLVRTIPWNIKSVTEDTVSLSVTTPSSALYPAELEVEQTFSISDDFCHTVRVTHMRGEVVPVNIACHYYWDTPRGWKKTMVNQQDITEKIEKNGSMDIEKKNRIVFPHATYEMHSTHFHSAALWTSFISDNQEKKYNADFCCIEPVIRWPHYFGSEKSFLRPKETISASIRIKKVV